MQGMAGKEDNRSLIQAVIFDLDGVLAHIGNVGVEAWLRLAKEQGVLLDEEAALRLTEIEEGPALDKLLRKAKRAYSPAEKLALTARKNDLYDAYEEEVTPDQAAPGAREMLEQLKAQQVPVMVMLEPGCSQTLLRRLRLDRLVTGTALWPGRDMETGLIRAANQMGFCPGNCLAIVAPRHRQAAAGCGVKAVIVGGNEEADACWASDLTRINIMDLIVQDMMAD